MLTSKLLQMESVEIPTAERRLTISEELELLMAAPAELLDRVTCYVKINDDWYIRPLISAAAIAQADLQIMQVTFAPLTCDIPIKVGHMMIFVDHVLTLRDINQPQSIPRGGNLTFTVTLRHPLAPILTKAELN